MADNDYRAYRSRDPAARDDFDPTARESASDPLAELARLIGQSDPYADGDRDRYAESGDDVEAAPGVDWATDDGYAEQQHVHADDRYVQPPAESYPSYAPSPRGYDSEPPPTDNRFFSGPAAKFNGFRENGGDYQTAEDAHYRDEHYRDEPPPVAPGRQQPAFTSAAADDRYAADEQEHHDGDHDYGADDYYDEAPRRRGGFVVVMAVLGLAVLGTAGAFGYRAMFGASVLPTLPPIIKAGNGPNKIMPSYGDAQGSNSSQTGAASAGSTEKLVSREEQPVDIQQPPTAPRVVSTIPISPGANQVVPPGMASMGAPAQTAPAATPWPASSPAAPPPAMAQPAAMAPVPPPAPAPAAVSAEPKKVHTVTIKANQSAPAADVAAAPPAPAPAPRATRTAAAPKQSVAASAPASGNAPLSLVPSAQDDGAPLPPPPAPGRTRAAMARTSVASAAPAPVSMAAASSSGGGYAVQVTSQRSEADAQAAFRELRSKFPNQLGGKEPIVRRADLGAKGVYYRALVGPFASMEAAAGMCSSLKAAGGNCLVQRN